MKRYSVYAEGDYPHEGNWFDFLEEAKKFQCKLRFKFFSRCVVIYDSVLDKEISCH